jgi:hypothetical protein
MTLNLLGLTKTIPSGFTWFGILSVIFSLAIYLFQHFRNFFLKPLTIEVSKFMEAGQYSPMYGNGLKIEIINSTDQYVKIKKNIGVTGYLKVAKFKGRDVFGQEKSYVLEIEGRDSSHAIQSPKKSDIYSASSKKNVGEQLPTHLYLAKISVRFSYGSKLIKQIVRYYTLQNPMEGKYLSFWQYQKALMQHRWFPKIQIRMQKKLQKIFQRGIIEETSSQNRPKPRTRGKK